MIISFELKKPQSGETADELEVFLDHAGLESLLAQLKFLQDGRTEHVHLMAESWGGSHLNEQPQGQENTVIHHVTILLR
ncbi:MAG: immunity protein 32 [Gammaproteobacteria bacterium]|nr:immunity protein 32 [Gammaproteobacteria bacterium]